MPDRAGEMRGAAESQRTRSRVESNKYVLGGRAVWDCYRTRGSITLGDGCACGDSRRLVVEIELAVPDGARALRARSRWRRSGGAAPPLGHCGCDREVC